MPENDNAAPDAIDEVLNEFFERSVPMLRALLKERFGAPKAPRRAIVREASTDRDGADEVTRARARAILSKHTSTRGR